MNLDFRYVTSVGEIICYAVCAADPIDRDGDRDAGAPTHVHARHLRPARAQCDMQWLTERRQLKPRQSVNVFILNEFAVRCQGRATGTLLE